MPFHPKGNDEQQLTSVPPSTVLKAPGLYAGAGMLLAPMPNF